jgi:hypothetical protein
MKNYSAGWNMSRWNMSGYLPKNEPAEFKTFEEAKNYIILELFRYMHELYDAGELDDTGAERVEVAIHLLKKTEKEFAVNLGEYLFWVRLLH